MDTQVVPGMVVFGGAGGRSNEGRVNVDGISVGSAFNGAGVSSYIADVGNAREVTMTTSGGLGEAEGGGPALNIVPKEGGNSVRGSFYAAGVTEGMIGSNYTDELRTRGLTTPGETRKVWDFNLGVGGPIKSDRVWFFGTFRDEGSERSVPGMFANANAGDPTKWTYVADRTRPAVNAASYRMMSMRVTAQVTPRNKVAIFWDEQKPCEGGAAAGFSGNACRTSTERSRLWRIDGRADAVGVSHARAGDRGLSRLRQSRLSGQVDGARLQQAAARSRLRLLPQPMGRQRSARPRRDEPDPRRGAVRDRLRGQRQHSGADLSLGQLVVEHQLEFAVDRRRVARDRQPQHKVGYQGALLFDDRKNFTNSEFLQYRFNNGVPDQMTLSISAFPIHQRVRSDAFFAQEQWTRGRMTLQGALRYDHAWSYFPEQTVGPVRFFPTAKTYPHTVGVEGYHDLWPRGGVAYDLFGNGKTSVKVNIGRYLEAAQNGGTFVALNPTGRLSTTTTRAWTDSNGNFRADCDLLNPAAQNSERERRRRLRREHQRELRHRGLRVHARSGAALGLGRALR